MTEVEKSMQIAWRDNLMQLRERCISMVMATYGPSHCPRSGRPAELKQYVELAEVLEEYIVGHPKSAYTIVDEAKECCTGGKCSCENLCAKSGRPSKKNARKYKLKKGNYATE